MGMDNRDSYYNIYESDAGLSYLTLNPACYVVFQYKEPGGTWDRSQTIHINDETIYQFNKGWQRFYRTLTRPDMFSYGKDGNISCNGTKKDKEVIQLRNGEIMELEPAVIFDKTTPLPGVNIYINHSENKADLSIDEYEAVMYKFSRIDIGSQGMQLIITRLLLDKQLAETKSETDPGFRNKQPTMNIFQRKENSQVQEMVEDNRVVTQKESIKTLDDIL